MMWPKSTIPPKYRKEGVTEKEWINWQWQLRNSIKNSRQPAAYYKGKDEIRMTPYLLSLIDHKNFKKDPIAMQHFPTAAETKPDLLSFDEVWGQKEDFLDGKNRLLQQKYPDIVVLRISNTCQAFCRFCFEKERTLRHDIPTKTGQNEFLKALKIIRGKKNLRQVLLSGGDPSILPDTILEKYLKALCEIPQIKTIRINTRTLLHNPYRITPEFAKMLGRIQKESWENFLKDFSKNSKNKQKRFKGDLNPPLPRGKQIKIGVHFNHPKELTLEAISAIRSLQAEGIELYNQTVLLKNINDDARILQKLFRKLREEGVELHYLSHAMAVPGTSHFRTTVKKAQEIMAQLQKMKEFRGQLPHAEMSHHKGKQLIPSSMNKNFYEDTIIKKGKKQKIIRFISDITGKWEIFPDGD